MSMLSVGDTARIIRDYSPARAQRYAPREPFALHSDKAQPSSSATPPLTSRRKIPPAARYTPLWNRTPRPSATSQERPRAQTLQTHSHTQFQMPSTQNSGSENMQ